MFKIRLAEGGEYIIKKILLIIGGIFVALVIIGLASGGSKTQTTTKSVVQEQETSTPIAKEQAVQKVKVEEQKPTIKQWTSVIELKGNATKSSDTFKLTGGKVKVTYNFTGNTAVVGAIYVLKEGTDLMKDGGIPEVMVSQSGQDSTIIRKSAGEYYLQVSTANSSYTVTLEEEK